jgi:rhamnosyltransferase subunit B
MARIVFTTWGSLGDLHPYLALALEAQRRGHVSVICTLPVYRGRVQAAGVEFSPLRPDVPADDPAAHRELVRRLLDAREGPRHLFTKVFAPHVRETYDDTLAAVRAGGGADLLVSHQVPITSPVVAEVTGVRWASAMLLPMGFLSAHDPPTPPQAPVVQKIAALHPAIARGALALARVPMRSWVEPVHRLRSELGLPPGRHPLVGGQHSPTLVLALFSNVLAKVQPDYPPNALITGFPFYDAADKRPPEPALLRFLDAGDPPIVFTLGSSAVWIAEDFYRVGIEAAQRLNRRAVLLAGEGSGIAPGRLPHGVAAFEYAPHNLVMPRASTIVHQGGIGTTGQALRAGRPMLIVPFGQDQPDNARRCVNLGVARTITRSRYRVESLVRELTALSAATYQERAAEVGRVVRAEQGASTACDALERLLGGADAAASRQDRVT